MQMTGTLKQPAKHLIFFLYKGGHCVLISLGAKSYYNRSQEYAERCKLKQELPGLPSIQAPKKTAGLTPDTKAKEREILKKNLHPNSPGPSPEKDPGSPERTPINQIFSLLNVIQTLDDNMTALETEKPEEKSLPIAKVGSTQEVPSIPPGLYPDKNHHLPQD